jgi:phage host-nuclease inhibitor protein Gam
MTDVPEEKAVEELEIRLVTLADTEMQLTDLTSEVDKKMQALRIEYAPRIDQLTELRETTVTEITAIFQQHRGPLTEETGKTATLRGGTLSARLGNEALEIVDATRLEKFLRRKGRWLKYTIQPPRRIDKTALKKDRSLIESAPRNTVRFTREENLIIKLPKLQLEIKQILHPLRSSLKKS